MKKYFLLLAALVYGLLVTAQTNTVKVAGKVYYRFTVSGGGSRTTSYNQYPADVKVILIQSQFTGDIVYIKERKRSFCSNDKDLIERFRARITYTKQGGSYEFSGLQRNTTYFLIFCDKNIQISEISTGNKITTYRLRDKQVVL